MKNILYSIIFIITTIPCYSNYEIGVKGSFHFKRLYYGKEYQFHTLKSTFHGGLDAGIFTKFFTDRKFYFQPEILYSYQFNPKQTQKLNIVLLSDYISLPLLVGYKKETKNDNYYRFFAGFDFHFMLDNAMAYCCNGSLIIFDDIVSINNVLGIGLDIKRLSLDLNIGFNLIESMNSSYQRLFIKMNWGWKLFQNNNNK